MLGQGTVSTTVSVSTKTCLRSLFRRNRGHGVDTVRLLDTLGHGAVSKPPKPAFCVPHEQPNSLFAPPCEVVLAKFAAPVRSSLPSLLLPCSAMRRVLTTLAIEHLEV
jgi:hypothetical protein